MTVGNGRMMCWKVASACQQPQLSRGFFLLKNNVILQHLNFRMCYVSVTSVGADVVLSISTATAMVPTPVLFVGTPNLCEIAIKSTQRLTLYRIFMQRKLKITWFSLMKFRFKTSMVVVDCLGSLPVIAVMLNWLTMWVKENAVSIVPSALIWQTL